MIAAALHLPASSPPLLSLSGGRASKSLPFGFVHDFSRSQIGASEAEFQHARRALESWTEFDLGWARIADSAVPIIEGQIVAVEVRAAWLWSFNFSRITETIETPERFGFLYSTTARHVEEGQERFLIEYDPRTNAVHYVIEAVSRPRHPLARLAYPYTRIMQHRFARESHARMRRAVAGSHSPNRPAN